MKRVDYAPEGEDDHPRLRVVDSIPVRQFGWQSSFRDHIIRDDLDLENHFLYIHNNPVKHGYAKRPEDWLWSIYSDFRNQNYALIDPVPG